MHLLSFKLKLLITFCSNCNLRYYTDTHLHKPTNKRSHYFVYFNVSPQCLFNS